MPDRLRVAMVGAGWWASTAHLPALSTNPRVDLVAVCDHDPARARSAAEAFGTTSFTDVDHLLASVGMDAVVVATPHHTHHEIVAAALTADRHVLVEKPIVTRADHAWELVELARSRDLILSAGHTYQYTSTATRVREAVQHQIGELVSVTADFPSATARLFASTDPDHDHLDDPASPHGTTFSNPATGGGQGYTQLCHLLGAVCWAAHDQATDVAAFTARRGLDVDVVDALTFRFAGGALGTAASTGTNADGVSPGQPIRFHGTLGMVEWDLAEGEGTVRELGGRVERVTRPVDQPAYPLANVSASFVRLLAGAGPDFGPADDAAASIAIIDAAHASARTRTVTSVRQGRLTDLQSGRS